MSMAESVFEAVKQSVAVREAAQMYKNRNYGTALLLSGSHEIILIL